MDLKQFIYDLETNDLHHYARMYKNPIWGDIVFLLKKIKVLALCSKAN